MRVHGGGGGVTPLEIGKKMLSEEILTFFNNVLLIKLGGIDIHCIHATYGRGWADKRLSMMEGVGALPPPPVKKEKKEAIRGIFNLFHLYFANEIRGRGSAYMQHRRGWADRRVSMVRGREERCALPPLEIGKKMLSEEILTSFTYVLLIKLGGEGIDIHCIHAKWKGVGGQALVHGGKGWRRGVLPLLESEKRGCQKKF